MTTIRGVDVSSNQGVIAWPAVAKSGIQFAFVKASEGTTYANPYFISGLRDAAAAGIAPAAYHFALIGRNNPEPEAQHFLDVAGPYLKPGYPVALDAEEDPYGGAIPADCGPWATAWIAYVQKALGCIPLVYTNTDLIQNHGLSVLAAQNVGLWLAAPGSVQPAPPAPWGVTACWQYSWTASVPGISGAVDANQFAGDVTTFQAYGLPQPVPVPVPPVPVLKPFDVTARLQLCGFSAGGSGVADLTAWLSGYSDAVASVPSASWLAATGNNHEGG